jgi:hypothetical protein
VKDHVTLAVWFAASVVVTITAENASPVGWMIEEP